MYRRANIVKLIDVHSHILPGIDDGSEDLEESKSMLELAYNQGIRTIIATPHYRRGQNIDELKRLTGLLRQEAKKLDPEFGIFLGQELMDSEDTLEELLQGKALTMAESRYVLIEFYPGVSYNRLCQRLRQLQMAGFIPIVAHAERYACLRESGQERLEELIEAGNRIQMNYRSLSGSLLDKRTRWCRRQVQKGNVHLLGTDMHNTGSRAPETEESIKWMEKHCTRRQLYRLIRKNAESILEKKEGMER